MRIRHADEDAETRIEQMEVPPKLRLIMMKFLLVEVSTSIYQINSLTNLFHLRNFSQLSQVYLMHAYAKNWNFIYTRFDNIQDLNMICNT